MALWTASWKTLASVRCMQYFIQKWTHQTLIWRPRWPKTSKSVKERIKCSKMQTLTFTHVTRAFCGHDFTFKNMYTRLVLKKLKPVRIYFGELLNQFSARTSLNLWSCNYSCKSIVRSGALYDLNIYVDSNIEMKRKPSNIVRTLSQAEFIALYAFKVIWFFNNHIWVPKLRAWLRECPPKCLS